MKKNNFSKTDTYDGVEITFNENFNEQIEYLPANTNIIIFNNEYNCAIDNLPNQVSSIFLGREFNCSVDNLPNELKFISFGANFNHSIDCLHESVEEIRISQFYNQKINKLPKLLKKFNIVIMTKKFFVDVENDSYNYIQSTSTENHLKIYEQLELKYADVEFYY